MGPCCVEGCELTSEKTFYFEFPTSRLLRRKWLEVIPIPGKLPLGTVVCSRHFNADDYDTIRGKVRLKSKVVPSLRLEEAKKPKKTKNPPKEIDNPPKSPPKLDNCDSTTAAVSSSENEKPRDEQPNNIPTAGKQATPGQEKSPKADTADTQANSLREEQSVAKDSTSGDLRRVSVESNEICKVVHKENGRSGDCDNVVIRSPHIASPDPKEDIEEMITNYHIKNKLPNTVLLPDNPPAVSASETETIEIEHEPEAPPVFIEISVDKDAGANEAGSQDCLMLLESVQVDVDPTTLLLDHDYEVEQEKDRHGKEDPISLLTSSDEDEVIIQEPHIDTVEVSDETDEDDVPLVKLVKKRPQKKKHSKRRVRKIKTPGENIEKIVAWDVLYDFYCVQCHFSTKDSVEYNRHVLEHSTVLQVCPICGYTSASKTMFSRHMRRHKEEKKFKCHLCDYRAKHKMSLIYHLQCHERGSLRSAKKPYTCPRCGFKSDDNGAVFRHIRSCTIEMKYLCKKCVYVTTRKANFIRHKLRKHKDVSEVVDEYVPES